MFNETINENKNKQIQKHITLTIENYLKLSDIQTAYKLNNNSTIDFKTLINIAIIYFINDMELKSNLNEKVCLKEIEKLHDQYINKTL